MISQFANRSHGFTQMKHLKWQLISKELSMLWKDIFAELHHFSITYYLFEGGTQPWKLTMLP